MTTETAPRTSPTRETESTSKPEPRWKVILHDDSVTTIDFVIWLLVKIFAKTPPEAVELTYEVHTSGSAVVALTHQERAELYVEQVRSLARPRGFPLTATMERE